MTETACVDVLLRQYARSWRMLEEAIRRFSAEQWREGSVGYLTPARTAYHVVESADFYAGETADGFRWGHRFGGDWEGMSAEALPSQADVLAYLAEVRPKAEAWLRAGDLLAEDVAFAWTGGTFLDRALYLLRHTHHHVGEMWAALKCQDCTLPDWH